MKLSFTKMQGCANDYIYLDCRKSGVPENIAALSEKLSRLFHCVPMPSTSLWLASPV
jgi:diaminopimelate epimerase